MAEVISQPGGAGTEREAPGPKQSADRRQPNFEPSEDEKTAVRVWLQRVQRAEDEPKFKEWRENLETLRGYLAGTYHKDKTNEKLTRTNMIFATIAAMMPELYAKNPTIAVTPTDAVSEAELGKVKKFCATADKVIRKMLVEEGKLKKRAKANIRAACATSFGVLKVTYQKEYRGDPVMVRRIEDTQDNLARVEALIQQLKKTDDPNELATKRDQLRANLQALASGNEVEIYKGFVIDRMKSEDFLVLDDNVDEFDEYIEARALGHKIWMTVGQARQLFQMELHGATRFGRPRTDPNQKTDDTPSEEQFVCVIEIWDKENGVVRTTAKGMNRWLREPYPPKHTPQRWYSFYVLGFNLIEGRWRPISDVELLKGLQDEYATTRTNYADVREKAAPKRIIRKGGNLSEQDVLNIMQSGNKDWVAVEGNPNVPINQDVMQLDGLKVDPAAYDLTAIRNDMDLVSGRSDASRANLIKPKTATEAEIMQEAMQSRVGERRDTHEDLLSEMGEAALEIALRDLTKAEVQQLAGEDAEWPESPETVETIFRMVSVKVRAGSSGRPNMQREREQWTQLMPVIKDTMQQVAELRAMGNYDQAEALIELLRETIRRFDENLDLDAIIPPTEKDETGRPIAHQQAAMEVVALKQQLAEAQEQLRLTQEEIQKLKGMETVKLREAELRAEEESRANAAKEAEAIAEADRERLRQEAEAKRANDLKIAQEAAKAEEARIADERAERELAAKVETDKELAFIKAAAQILGDSIKAKAQAAAAAQEGEKEREASAEQQQADAEQIKAIFGELRQTMEGLKGAFEQLAKDSQARTALVKEHLGAGE
jgi:hypothetical protein